MIGFHVLIGDTSGRSVILEYCDGELQAIPNGEPWQVITNMPVYDLTIHQQRAQCVRFQTIYDRLESAGGSIGRIEGMNILSSVGHYYTQWSAVYDMTSKVMDLALDFNFGTIYHFSLDEAPNP